tara:strand:- start:137 stop:922 length:786 start_codon:yes stop_codon:yes gene_type:complete
MSLIGKKLKDAYKDILTISNSNSGLTTSTKKVLSGNGNQSCLSISDDQALIQPNNDDTTSAMRVTTQAGNVLMDCDTTNREVQVNGHYVNTQFKDFGVYDISPTQGHHHPLLAAPAMYATSSSTWSPVSFGSGTDPDTSETVANTTANLYPPIYWYLHSNITIDAVFVFAMANGTTTANFHILSYDLVTGSGSTAGDLSNGTLIAHAGSALTLGDDRVSTTTLTIDSADVAAGKVIIAFVENIGSTDDLTVNMNLKYHLNA